MRKSAQFAIILALLVAAQAGQAAPRKARESGPAPAGCSYGPRGGLHCNTVKFERTTDEQRRLEDRRMRRECKGRPNAGACLGYAS